jgi:hypothetical protein
MAHVNDSPQIFFLHGCAAFADRIGGEVVIADRHHFEPLVPPNGVCMVKFIR